MSLSSYIALIPVHTLTVVFPGIDRVLSLSPHVIAITLPCSFLLFPHLRVCLHTHTQCIHNNEFVCTSIKKKPHLHTQIPHPHPSPREGAVLAYAYPSSFPLCPPCYCERTLAEWWRDVAEGSKVWPTGCTRKKYIFEIDFGQENHM